MKLLVPALVALLCRRGRTALRDRRQRPYCRPIDDTTQKVFPMPYVASIPLAFIGHPSVGTGECVPLVEAATGAPGTWTWSRGAMVRGNFTIKPGTAVATFDPTGRYGNHTNGTSHTAIYLGQTAAGIEVVDQWNIRKGHRVVGKHPPSKRLIRFSNPGAKAVDQGGNYYVVE